MACSLTSPSTRGPRAREGQLGCCPPRARVNGLEPDLVTCGGRRQATFLGETEPRAARPKETLAAGLSSRPKQAEGCQCWDDRRAHRTTRPSTRRGASVPPYPKKRIFVIAITSRTRRRRKSCERRVGRKLRSIPPLDVSKTQPRPRSGLFLRSPAPLGGTHRALNAAWRRHYDHRLG